MINIGRLRVSNFKSFKHEFLVDFSNTKLYILNGPNGFGKTTLFDAIEFCFSGRVGRIKKTDSKNKNSHLLKNDNNEITSVFLELKENNETKIVIYAYLPKNTSKKDNQPEQNITITKLLKEWPTNFENEMNFVYENELTVEELIDNQEIKSTFGLFNYIQQEDACHFLKNKESERHKKISYLLGTSDHTEKLDKIRVLKKELKRKIGALTNEFNIVSDKKMK